MQGEPGLGTNSNFVTTMFGKYARFRVDSRKIKDPWMPLVQKRAKKVMAWQGPAADLSADVIGNIQTATASLTPPPYTVSPEMAQNAVCGL
jgi:hypothetical protein